MQETRDRFGKRRAATLMLAAALLLVASSAFAQQTNVTRFDAFVGYAYLNSPKVSLAENGVQFQIGVRPKTWVSLGFDYSFSTGDLTLTPGLLTPALQTDLTGLLELLAKEGLLPPGYALSVTAFSRTQTFAAGPQFAYRHFKNVTLFVRPSCGIIKEVAAPLPSDPIQVIVVGAFEQMGLLSSAGKKNDSTPFYGVGGGIDLLFSKHFGVRIQGDEVYDHLFSDLLAQGRWTTRFSVGPILNFGKNIVKTK